MREKKRMGLISKLIIAAIIIVAAWYAYNNIKIDTMTICINPVNQTQLNIGCTTDQNCADYLTSPYINGYPDTKLYQAITSQTTSCKEGVCFLKKFRFSTTCSETEELMPFKVTLKDLLAQKGINI